MRSKFLSYIMILCLVVTSISLIPAKAAYPQPRIDLDEYTINVTDNTGVYVEGTVSKAHGQNISVRDTAMIPIAIASVEDSGNKEEFKIKIPAAYIKSGNNIFYVISEAVSGKLDNSNPQEFKVNFESNKKSQTITASNKSVYVGSSISLGAKSSSGLSLTYKSSNPSIATVDMNGKVIGRTIGTVKIIISQGGNATYEATNKTITVTVKNYVAPKSKENIAKAKVSKVKMFYKYSKKKISPKPVLKINNKKLKLNRDYMLKYRNNTKEGWATINITGKGDYAGNKVVKFRIYKYSGDGYSRSAILNNKVYKLYRQDIKSSYRNSRFGNSLPAKAKIYDTGCGPTSIAIVMSGYEYNLNPGQVGAGLLQTTKKLNGGKNKGGVTNNRVFSTYLKSKGFKVKKYSNDKNSYKYAAKRMRTALKKGHQVVFWIGHRPEIGGPNYKSTWKKYTDGGFHYISILAISKNGKSVYVGNPNGKSNGWNNINNIGKVCGNYRGWLEVWK